MWTFPLSSLLSRWCDGEVSVLTFGTVRVLKGEGGEIWFVALDVCKALGPTDARKSVGLLDEDERNTVPVTDSLGREQHTFIINESGLYSLILRSRKPEAIPSVVQFSTYGD